MVRRSIARKGSGLDNGTIRLGINHWMARRSGHDWFRIAKKRNQFTEGRSLSWLTNY